MSRTYSLLDKIVIEVDSGLETVFGAYSSTRPRPSASLNSQPLDAHESKQSAGLMRVNLSGEVCAQALYRGQLRFAKSNSTRHLLEKAAEEEGDHLAWCDERLKELNASRSLLNFFWYWNSYAIGAFAAYLGDPLSLGFLKETEIQVEQHLHSHLKKLPQNDHKSRAIIEQMKIDEAQHSHAAQQAGAKELPTIIKKLMRLTAKSMTALSYYF